MYQFHRHVYISFFLCIKLAEEAYWNSSPCSSDSLNNGRDCSPNRYHLSATAMPTPVNQQRNPFSNQTTPVYSYPQHEQTEETYEDIYYTSTSSNLNPIPFVRVVKRRTTANKKERRRTQSINSAFAYLRDCIPNVPSDTKLSKVSFSFS